MRILLLAAVAALSAPLTATAGEPAIVAQQTHDRTALHDHIRTTLYGTEGPVVVLIPGMSTPGAMWDDHVAQLQETHRVLVVELRGFGGERGTANEAEGALDGTVSDIAADLAARKLGPATVSGHSLGGLIALKLALGHPQAVTNLLVIDALPFFGTVFDSEMTLEKVEPRATQMRDMIIAGADMMREAGRTGTASGDGARGMSVRPDNALTIANWALKAEPLAVAQLVYEDTMTDLRQDIARITVPVTVLHMANGDHRAIAVERYATDYAALPGVKMVPVNDTGHFVQLDQPATFQRELRALTGK